MLGRDLCSLKLRNVDTCRNKRSWRIGVPDAKYGNWVEEVKRHCIAMESFGLELKANGVRMKALFDYHIRVAVPKNRGKSAFQESGDAVVNGTKARARINGRASI